MPCAMPCADDGGGRKYFKDDQNRVVAAVFEELPSKKQYPDYYDIVSKPMCLSTIDKVGSSQQALLLR